MSTRLSACALSAVSLFVFITSATAQSAPPTINTATLANWDVNLGGYNQSVAVSGGRAPYTWAVTAGTFPQGLNLNSATGAITGTPTQVNTFQFSIMVTDARLQTVSQGYTVTINQQVSINNAPGLPGGAVNESYAQAGSQLGASWGTGQYTWSVPPNTLPAGLSLNSNTGAITGITTAAGNYQNVNISATDTLGQTATTAFSITINPQLAIAPVNLPVGVAGIAYNGPGLQTSGGSAGISWSLASGTVSNGTLAFQPGGNFSGTPTSPQTISVTVRVTDRLGGTATMPVSFTINPPLSITTTANQIPTAVQNIPYNFQVQTAGGSGGLGWVVSSGALPPGININASGVLTGSTSAAPGGYAFQLRATDSDNENALSPMYTLQMAAPVTITTSTLPNGGFGDLYSQTIATTGGSGNFTWSISAGALPQGVGINPTTGLISGTATMPNGFPPNVAEQVNFTVQVVGAAGDLATQAYGFLVNPTLAVSTAIAPAAVQGDVYSATLAATGGSGTFTWSITPANALPTGLSLTDPVAGVISGTASVTGSFPFTATVTDSNGGTASKALTLYVNAAGKLITSNLLPGMTIVNVSGTQDGAANFNNGQTIWFSPFSTTQHLLEYTVQPGTYTFRVIDPADAQAIFPSLTAGQASSMWTAWTYNSPWVTSYLVFDSSAATNSSVGQIFSGAEGAGFTSALLAYNSAESSGVYNELFVGTRNSQTPVKQYHFANTETLIFAVPDNDLGDNGGGISVLIAPVEPTLIIPGENNITSLPAGQAGTPYTPVTLTATGGSGVYQWSNSPTNGPLPAGMTISPGGVISGTPTAMGTFARVLFVATDPVSGASQGIVYSLQITGPANPLNITTSSPLPGAQVNTLYSQTIHATGGFGAYTWAMTPIGNASGLTINASTGAISGTIATPGTYSFTVTVTDAATDVAQGVFTVSELGITISVLPSAIEGESYNQLVPVAGATGSVTWTVSAGALPAGLQLIPSTGDIVGAPTSLNNAASFAVSATDSANNTVFKLFSILVSRPAQVSYMLVDRNAGLISISDDGSNSAVLAGPSASGYDVAQEAGGNFIVAAASSLLRVTPIGSVATVAQAPVGTQWIAAAIDGTGNIIAVDNLQHAVWRVSPDGSSIVEVANYPAPSPASLENAKVLVDTHGNYIVAEDNGGASRIFVVTPGGPPTEVSLSTVPVTVGGFTFDHTGNYILEDSTENTLYQITPGGTTTTILSGVVGMALARNPVTNAYGVASNGAVAEITGTHYASLFSGSPLFHSPRGMIAVTSDFVSAVDATNPVGYFRLEATSAVSEVNGLAYQFSPTGAALSSPGAPIGDATSYALLDGNSGAVGTNEAGNVGTAGSVMAWVNLAALPSCDPACNEGQQFRYVAGESTNGNDFDLQFTNDNVLRFYTTNNGANISYTPNPATLAGQWHMIVTTFDAGATPPTRAIYWDGQLVAQDNTASLTNKPGSFEIGASNVFPGRNFHGGIDEVGLWNYSLTPAEVYRMFAETSGTFGLPIAPTVLSLLPNTTPVNSASVALIVTGQNLSSTTGVWWTPAGGQTTVLGLTGTAGNTLVTATVPGSLLTAAGLAEVSVVTGGVPSNQLPFTISGAQVSITTTSLPSGTQFQPYVASVAATGGSGNYSWSIVSQNTGLNLAIDNSGNLTGTPTSNNTDGGLSITVMVTDTGTNLTASQSYFIIVEPGAPAAPAPVISSLAPSSARAGGPAFTLTVNGSNFVSGATVEWGATALTTTFVSAAQLTASVSMAQIASAGPVNVTVVNPDSGTSSASTFTVNPSTVTTTTLLSSATPAVFGQAVTLTANVSAVAATGKVTFYDGTTMLGIGTLTGGVAHVTTNLLPAGSGTLRAYYAGDVNYAPSTAVPAVQTVNANPSGTLTTQAAGSPFLAGFTPCAVTTGDFNGDGIQDLAVVNNEAGNVAIFLGAGAGVFNQASGSPHTAGTGPCSVAVADFNGDGIQDIAVGNQNTNNITVLLGSGMGIFSPAAGSPFPAGSNPFVTVGDFNGDGIPDLATANFGSNNVTVLLGDGLGNFNAAQGSPFAAGSSPVAIVVGDFNGDGKADIATANFGGNSVTVLLGTGTGGFGAAQGSPFPAGTSPRAIAIGDFTGNHVSDLAIANESGNNVTVLLGTGLGGFNAAQGSPFPAGTNPFSVAVGDLNGDGIQDLAFASDNTNSITVLLGTGGGAFSLAPGNPIGTDSSPVSVVVGDFNGDGRADLAVANEDSNDVTILLGGLAPTGSLLSTTSPANITLGTAVPLSLAVSDSGTAFNAPTGTVTFSDGSTVLGVAAQTAPPYTFNATGLAAGSHTFTASYGGDSRTASSASNSVVITVGPSATQPLTITSGAPPNGMVNVSYGPFMLTASGGSGSYLWSVGGVSGVGVNSANGVLSGTPTTPGNFTLTITLTDGSNPSSSISQNYSVSIAAAGLTITTSSLPGGVQNQAYSASLVGSGGSGTYNWAISGIAGLTVNASTGAIGGSPTVGGNVTLNVTLTDALNSGATPATGQYAVNITFAPLTIKTPGALGEFAPNAAISTTFAATGGSPAFTWSATGVPTTLTLTPATGQITGNAPAKPGNYSFPLKVSDTETPVASDSTTVTFSVLGITTPATLPSGTTSTAYSLNFIAMGGMPPYTFSSPNVPAGLTLSSSGFLNGTPAKAITSSFQVLVTDASGISPVSGTFSLTVGTGVQPIQVSGAALPDGAITTSYSQPLEAQDGQPSYNWTLLGGTLPAGLALSSAGTISGTPTATGTATFTARATDSAGGFSAGVFSININPTALQVTVAALPNAMAGLPYGAQPINATGGFPPYSFAITQGSLPSPLTFGNGQINSGVPAAAGTSAFTVTATDAVGNTASGSFTLVVEPTHPDLILSQASVSFSLVTGAVTLPPAANVTVGSSVAASLGYNVQVNPPAPWLDVTANGSTPDTIIIGLDAANAPPLGSGIYQTTVTVACPPLSGCSGNHNVAVSLTVTSPAPQLSVGSNLISFSATGNSSQTLAQPLNLQNSGGGVVTIQSVSAAASWVKFDPATIPPPAMPLAAGQTLQVNVFADTTALSGPGYYQSTITVTTDAGSATVPVTLLIAANATMTLAPAGSQFNTVAGSAPGNSNGSFLVAVSGSSTVNWTAAILPSSPAATWLTLSTPSGSSTSGSPGAISFSINGAAAGLAAQPYYATIEVTVTGGGVTDPVQDYQVVLNAAPAGNILAPNPDPSGLIFISTGPGALPAQIVSLGSSAAYTAKSESPSWLSVAPAATPGQSSVSVNTTGLANGVYHGGVIYAIAGQVRTVNVTLIVTGAAAGHSVQNITGKAASPGCTATQIIPTQTGLVNNFSLPTAWPTPLQISVVDDCGKAVTTGQVVATFSNGDPPLVLPGVGGSAGVYSGTWTPRATASQVTISAQASALGFKPATVQITGQVTRNGAPVLNPGGTLNAFVPVVGSPLAPGMIVQIYGSNLASQVTLSSTIPLATSLNNTMVIIGGIAAPLYYVSPGQINAQVPFELSPGTSYQAIVNANGALSTPNPIQLAGDAPGIAAFASGGIIAQHVDGSLVTDAAPAAPGEYVVFYVSGMGQTTNPVASGAASPGSPNLATPTDPPTLTLNGVNIPVSFAGLTPTLVGLYQVDFQVPANTPNGDLQLVLTQTGGQSNSTILAVHN